MLRRSTYHVGQGTIPTAFASCDPVTWLALCTFPTGTEIYYHHVAARIGRDLSNATATGQLVAVFGATYAISSTALSGLTAGEACDMCFSFEWQPLAAQTSSQYHD